MRGSWKGVFRVLSRVCNCDVLFVVVVFWACMLVLVRFCGSVWIGLVVLLFALGR